MNENRHRCLSLEELLVRLQSDPGVLRSAEFQNCPQCASELLSLQTFIAADLHISDADLHDAESRLSGFIDSLDEAKPDAEIVPIQIPRRRPPRLWAVAAVLVAAIALPITMRVLSDPQETFRGQTEATALHAEVAQTDSGILRFRWEPSDATASHRVVFYDIGLSECVTVVASEDDHVAVDPALITAESECGSLSFWKIEAFVEDEILAESAILPMP